MSESTEPTFLYVICQVGVERQCKERMAERWPDIRFSFSRPGFLTFKMPNGPLPEGADLENAFVRTSGYCLGKIDVEAVESAGAAFWEQFGSKHPFDHIHVWQRDARPVGDKFEPFASEAAIAATASIKEAAPKTKPPIRFNQIAEAGTTVLDCVLVEPYQWWVGSHRANSMETFWVGGVPPIKKPESMLSRAYLKMHEAIGWSRLPMRDGDWCVEIGSAPGGAAQALLEHGVKVIGIDPAEMAPELLAHPNFKHIRMRGRDVRRKELSKARWLMTDANVTPTQTLDTIQDIVQNESVNIRGMLLTLKMPDWKLTDELPTYLKRIRGWGFKYVRPRHLAFNRQELCVVALRNKAMRRFA